MHGPRFIFTLALASICTGCGGDSVTTTEATGSTGGSTGGSTSGATIVSATDSPTAPTGDEGVTTSDTGEPVGCIVRVDGTNGDDASSGSTWGLAKRTFEAGLAEAEAQTLAGDGPCEVWVAAGTYAPTDALDIDASFMLRPGIAVYGGFAGGELGRDQRDWTAHETILSGELGDPADLEDNVRHVVLAADGARLDGFTVTGGYARGDVSQRDGGGILGAQVGMTVANCRIAGNRTGPGADGEIGTIGGNGGSGAGIRIRGGSLTLLDSVVRDNQTGDGGAGSGIGGIGGAGAGVNVDGGPLTVIGGEIVDNRTGAGGPAVQIGGGGGVGAGIYFVGGVVGGAVLRNVLIAGNRTGDGGSAGPGGGGYGGVGTGLYIIRPADKTMIADVDLFDNLGGAGGPDGGGGGGAALYAVVGAGDLEVVRVDVRDNVAGIGAPSINLPPIDGPGGAVLVTDIGAGSLTVLSARFEGNTAGFGGGLIVYANSMIPAKPVLVANSVIAGNTASLNAGGLVLQANGQRAVTIVNTTIAGNQAAFRSGGVWYQASERAGDAAITIMNSIVWGNAAMFQPSLDPSAVGVKIPVPLAVEVSAVEGGCPVDPLLVCSALLAGPPEFVDLVGGDLRLAPGSPLKDAGDTTRLPADITDLDDDGDLAEPLPVDLDGLPRVAGAAVEPGAHELQ